MTPDIQALLQARSDEPLLQSPQGQISGAQAWQRIVAIQARLNATDASTIAILCDNQPAWVLLDLACQVMGVRCIPLPPFFSQQQLQHAITSAGVDLILTDQSQRIQALEIEVTPLADLEHLSVWRHAHTESAQMPEGTAKITFTSGSTGEPKGVCLSTEQQWKVAQSLVDVIGEQQPIRHLCVLPLSTLLENIAGVYAPILAQGCIVTLPLAELGFNGSAEFDLQRLLQTLQTQQPNSLILLPQLLLALVSAIEQGWPVPASLRFVAVGGGKVAAHVVARAQSLGLPVYEGYGLSECASVVSLNTPEHSRMGSVGRSLAHVQVSIKDGHVVVAEQAFLGYLNDPQSWFPQRVDTGDLGRMDEDGYLYLQGRAKQILVSSFGRNIDPEWVESECVSGPVIQQCVVFGEAQPQCVALLLPRQPETTTAEIQQWVDQVNQRLPDYACIQAWALLTQTLSVNNGLLTANGRAKRAPIAQQYASTLERLFIPSEPQT